MIINYNYNNITLKEFKDKFPYAEIKEYGNIPLMINETMKKRPYVIVKTSSEEEQTEEMIILKFDN
jgi:hypothetical protein